MKTLYDSSSDKISKLITHQYSTSFSIGTKLFHESIRQHIYNVYAFVRLADEIVDSFEGYPQQQLFSEFKEDYKKSLENKISTNPVLNSFQKVVHDFKLEQEVESFLLSMEMDLHKSKYYTQEEYEKYIYGSADVVGLMCLKIFTKGDLDRFEQLKPYALKLGSAFQKVNFLRDLNYDHKELGRSYFPNIDIWNLSTEDKKAIIEEISNDFKIAFIGIKKLPKECRLGVYVTYRYYLTLLNKLDQKASEQILNERTRISDYRKGFIFLKSFLRFRLNLL